MHNSFCPRSLYHINLDSALARRNHFCVAKAGSLIVIWMCTMIKTNQLPIYLMLTPEGFVIIVFPIPVFWDASPFPSMQHGEYQLQYVPKQYHIFTNTWALVLVWSHLEICCVCSIVDVSNLWIAAAFWRMRFQHFFFLFSEKPVNGSCVLCTMHVTHYFLTSKINFLVGPMHYSWDL